MASSVRPTIPADEQSLIEFLTRIFAVGKDAEAVAPSLLRWKYWQPRADWHDPRSLVMEKDGRIVAHVGLWPVTVRVGEQTERGVQMIDWASDPQAPGTGVSLLHRLTKMYDFVYSIGGSDVTLSILPKFGFRTVARALTFARPIRPCRQAVHHQSRDFRLPARLARNAWWSLKRTAGTSGGWSVAPAVPGDLAGSPAVARERDAGFFHYLEQCPFARFQGFYMLQGGNRAGFFLLAETGRLARIAGAWLQKPNPDAWRAAFQLARAAALQHTRAAEFVVRIADEAGAAGAVQAGLRQREQCPVLLYRRQTGIDPLPLTFQMLDDDAIVRRRDEFLT